MLGNLKFFTQSVTIHIAANLYSFLSFVILYDSAVTIQTCSSVVIKKQKLYNYMSVHVYSMLALTICSNFLSR